jgi:hypothetical protein
MRKLLYGVIGLVCPIQVVTLSGRSFSSGLLPQENHDFVSFGLVTVRGCHEATVGFFGGGFFSPSVSPVLLKKFLVPVVTFAHNDGCFALLAVRVAVGFGSDFSLEPNSDQPPYAAGLADIATTKAAAIARVLALLILMFILCIPF